MSLFELSMRIKGFNIKKARQILSKSQDSLPKKLQLIVDYHKNNNPLYKSLLKGMDIQKFEDLPIVHKSDFQKPLIEVISSEYKLKDLYIGNTSGSSGTPFFYAKNKESHAITYAVILRLYAEHGITLDLKQARFYGVPLSGSSKYKEKIKDILSNRVRFPIYDLSDNKFEKYLDKFKRKRFIYIYGYTSAITLFSKFLTSRGIILQHQCPSLQKCIITSEVCTEEDRSIIEKALGVRVINEYGCSEAGFIAFERPDGAWRMVEDDSYFEIVDSNNKALPDGQEGKILITSLSNKAMPIIRYEVGDTGIIKHDEKGAILLKLCGRVNDIIKLPSGKIAGGLTFYYISRSVMESNNFIKEFIIRQTKINLFEFDIVSDRDLNKSEIDLLQTKLDEYLEPSLELKVNRVDKIERPSSGKIKHFYSEL